MKNDYIAMTESALFDFLPDENCRESKLIESMKYSLEAGGKRVRPRLVLSSTPCAAESPRLLQPQPAR